MFAALPVDVLDQCGQRRRLAAADASSNEDQSVLITCEQLQMLGQAELIHRADVRLDDPENDFRPESLPHNARPVTASRVCVGEIGVAALGHLRFL